MSVKKGKYKILRFPGTRFADIITVKVTNIYDNEILGTIVQYRDNWFITTKQEVLESEFESWIVYEKN